MHDCQQQKESHDCRTGSIYLAFEIFLHRCLTSVNGYLRTLMFGTELDSEQNSKLLRIVAFILSVYVPMCFLIHLNPCAPEGPAYIIFLRDLLLDFEVKDQDLAVTALKNVFIKHFVAWINPLKWP